jgi:hypothetical protein
MMDAIWFAYLRQKKCLRNPKSINIHCTVDEEGLFHAFGDTPSVACRDLTRMWYDHGVCTKISGKQDDDGNYVVHPDLLIYVPTTLTIDGTTVRLVPSSV